jgi:hypothetical protein
MNELVLVAESGGPTMLARVGIMRALNRRQTAPDAGPRRKKPRRTA